MSKKSTNRQSYQVQTILDSRIRANSQKLYLIKWKGYSNDYNTWEPFQHLFAVQEMVRAYQIKQYKLVMGNVSKKIYKTEKIKKRFEEMNKIHESRKMLSTFNVQNIQSQNKQAAQKSSFSIRKRPFKPRKRLSKKLPEVQDNIEEIQIDQQKMENQNVEQQIQLSNLVVNSNNEQIQQISNVTELKQNLQTGLLIKLRGKKLYSRFDKEQMQAQQCQDQLLPKQMENEQCQSENIQDIIMTSKKIESTKITFENNIIFFHIPFKSEGVYKQLKISKEQVFKISPEWLNNFFIGFQY